MASAVEAQVPGQLVPPGTGTSTRHLPSWPRAPRHNGSAAALWVTVPSLVLGWKSVVNTADSMAPSSRSGDIVVAAPSDSIGVGAGTVLVFDDPGGSGLVTHRTVGLNANGTYRTQFDGNGQADSTPLTVDQVVGVVRLLVQRVGLLINWYSARAWVDLAVWLTVLWSAVLVTRYALLQRCDPWVGPEVWVNASG